MQEPETSQTVPSLRSTMMYSRLANSIMFKIICLGLIIGSFKGVESAAIVQPAILSSRAERADPVIFSSTIDGVLNSDSPVFTRPNVFNRLSYYQAYQFTVSTSGNYTFRTNSSIDTYGVLYNNPMDPSNSSGNMIAFNDDGAGAAQFKITAPLDAGNTYVLVVTTFGDHITGAYQLITSGPSVLALNSFTPVTSLPMPTTTSAPVLYSSYFNGELNSNSPVFARPNGFDRLTYYQAYQFTVSMNGTYSFTTNSSFDTYGLLYEDPMDPSFPSGNLIAFNDDSGGSFQFKITTTLVTSTTYVLIVTSHGDHITGSFGLIASGPVQVSLASFNPATSLPMPSTTPSPFVYSTDTAGFLNASSPQFYRPNTVGRITYYHAFRFTVSTSGMYRFSTNSSIDTYGLLYDGEMDPSFPSNSLLAYNDDGGPGYGLQFKIIANLQTGSTYTIVVTTHGALITGAFRLVASGPVLLTLNSFLPVTSQPIFTTTEPAFTVSSTVNGSFTNRSAEFVRPYGFGTRYYYHAYMVTVVTTGTYSFTTASSIDTYGLLYDGTFNPSNPASSLLISNDDGGIGLQFKITTLLESNKTYTLVVTTHGSSVIGSYSLIASGPVQLSLTMFVPSTISPPSTTSKPYAESYSANFAGQLSSASPVFIRPNGYGTGYYYQAYSFMVFADGIYSFTTESNIDTYGLLYDGSFNASRPSGSLIEYNDDGGIGLQFKITTYLVALKTYTLVVTTHGSFITGPFSGTAFGPLLMLLFPLVQATNRPISSSTSRPSFAYSVTVAGVLNSDSVVFIRPNGYGAGYYLQAYSFMVSTDGLYSFTTNSSIDTYGLLYDDTFNTSMSSANLMEYDDDSGIGYQFKITTLLESSKTYTLVVTTHGSFVNGSYSLIASGPVQLSLTMFVPSTIAPPSTTSAPTFAHSTNFAGQLTIASPMFSRPNGYGTGYYYQAYSFMVFASGLYSFTTASSIDTYGLLYDDTFDPSMPSGNLMEYDDDGGIGLQFKITTYLAASKTYTLIVTTHRSSVVGSFSGTAAGPTPLALTAFGTTTTSAIVSTSTVSFPYSMTYNWTLSADSPTFGRPNGSGSGYFYQAFTVNISVPGTYRFRSSGRMYCYGLLYGDAFDPLRPNRNLLASDGENSDRYHFEINASLQAQRTYNLVVTTYGESMTGEFSIIASGPAQVTLDRFTATDTPRPPREGSDWTGGKTAGVIIGSIVFVALIGAVAYYFRKKHLNTKQPEVTAVYRDGQVTNRYSFPNIANRSATTNAGLAPSGSHNEQQGQGTSVA